MADLTKIKNTKLRELIAASQTFKHLSEAKQEHYLEKILTNLPKQEAKLIQFFTEQNSATLVAAWAAFNAKVEKQNKEFTKAMFKDGEFVQDTKDEKQMNHLLADLKQN